MSDTVRAIRITGSGTPENLTVSDFPTLVVKPGWMSIRVRAFGVTIRSSARPR